MADFVITSGAKAAEKYLDYSSCFSTNKKKELKFSEKDFKNVVKAKTKDKDNIAATELKSMFTGLTDEQAAYLIKTADIKGGKKGAKDDKLDWEELQLAIKTADEADKTFDGIVSFENFQKLVTDPAAQPIVEVEPTDEGDDTKKSAAKDDDKAITKTAPVVTTPSTPTKEDYFSYSHSQQGGGGLFGGNAGLLALAGFAIFAGIGLSGGFGGGACRNNYYGYGGYC